QQRQLIDKHTTQCEAAHTHQAAHMHLGVPIEDALEVLIEVLDSQRAQLVEDTPHLSTHIIPGPLASVSSHQPPPFEGAYGSQQRGVVVLVSQHIAYIGWQ